jgi:hypothetical protein
MKRSLHFITRALLLVATTSLALAEAPITITVKNFRSLTNMVAKVADTASPGSSGQILAGVQGMLSDATLEAIDTDRPWHAAVWIESLGGTPAMSLFLPTKDYSALKSSLEYGPLMHGPSGTAEVSESGSYAALYYPGEMESETASSAHKAWNASGLNSPDEVINISIQPSDPLRQQIVQSLAMVRMMIGGAFSSQSQDAFPGVDPMVMSQLLASYFDVLDIGLKGWEKLSIGLDLSGENLAIRQSLTAVDGSELSKWLEGGEGNLGTVTSYIDETSPAAFAMRWNANPAYMPTLKKFMRLSMQMQGSAPDSEAVTETEKLLDLMAPMQAAGTIDFANGMGISGVYQFPGRDIDEMYGLMRKFIHSSMQAQVGENMPYKEISIQEGHHKLGSQSVDRVTMAFNLDSPMYQMQGQKEVIEGMFPGGKMELDYAVKGDSLFVATPARMEQLLATSNPAAKTQIGTLRPTTVLAARLNMLKLIPQFMKNNPMVPENTRNQFNNIDSTGTDIRMTIDVDGSLKGETLVPLRFIKNVAQSM